MIYHVRYQIKTQFRMTDVILKGEIHSSTGDLAEEEELMQEGIDALVLEQPAEDSDYRITEGWFQNALRGLFYVLSPVYVSKATLERLAQLQNADIHYTREEDAEILRNAPLSLRAFSALLFYILLPSSVLVGISTKSHVFGSVFLLLSFFIPVFLLRVYNTNYNAGDRNRDRTMAKKIEKAAKVNNLVLAIVGRKHADGVKNHLSNDIDVRYVDPKYGQLSKNHLREVASPFFQMLCILFGLYVIIHGLFVRALFPLVSHLVGM